MNNKNEIVYYEEQHTMMYQIVKIFIRDDVCEYMLNQELNEDSKRELFQAYYLNELNSKVEISRKTMYGSWNASIGDISKIDNYLDKIVEKLYNKLTEEEIEINIKAINDIAGLSKDELIKSEVLKDDLLEKFKIKNNVKKLKV
jgi:hypothetical protein